MVIRKINGILTIKGANGWVFDGLPAYLSFDQSSLTRDRKVIVTAPAELAAMIAEDSAEKAAKVAAPVGRAHLKGASYFRRDGRFVLGYND
jgi:hypothetical protein